MWSQHYRKGGVLWRGLNSDGKVWEGMGRYACALNSSVVEPHRDIYWRVNHTEKSN